MSDDMVRHEGATSRDQSRQPATTPDSDYPLTIEEAKSRGYTLSIEEALALYDAAGLARTPRSIQRYCAKGDLEAHRSHSSFGDIFLIKPESVERHIAYINEVRPVATGRDLSRLVATDVAGENNVETTEHAGATTTDKVRQATTDPDMSHPVALQTDAGSHPVAADNRIVELLESENKFLRGQIAVKDTQIADMQERARETNLLINGLQRLLAPLLPSGDRDREARDGLGT